MIPNVPLLDDIRDRTKRFAYGNSCKHGGGYGYQELMVVPNRGQAVEQEIGDSHPGDQVEGQPALPEQRIDHAQGSEAQQGYGIPQVVIYGKDFPPDSSRSSQVRLVKLRKIARTDQAKRQG